MLSRLLLSLLLQPLVTHTLTLIPPPISLHFPFLFPCSPSHIRPSSSLPLPPSRHSSPFPPLYPYYLFLFFALSLSPNSLIPLSLSHLHPSHHTLTSLTLCPSPSFPLPLFSPPPFIISASTPCPISLPYLLFTLPFVSPPPHPLFSSPSPLSIQYQETSRK